MGTWTGVAKLLTKVSDEEYIAKIRRDVERCDRWRNWLIALYTVLLIGMFGMVAYLVRLVNVLAPLVNPQGMRLGLIFGMTFGFSVGIHFHGLVFGLANAVSGRRTERLLLKCLDALGYEPGEPVEALAREIDDPHDRLMTSLPHGESPRYLFETLIWKNGRPRIQW